MNFDETATDTDFRNIEFTEKYVTVYIESPDIVSYDDTVSMIMRCDEMFTELGSGNDHDFSDFCKKCAGFPEELPRWLRERVPAETYSALDTEYENELQAFQTKWHRNPYDGWGIFTVSLFGSNFIDGPTSFVNLKTGKVAGVTTIGKWPGDLSEYMEELEWFAGLYPKYKFFLTFKDTEIVCTLMLYNGEIKAVKTRTAKEVRHCLRVNHLEGSTCAKRPNFVMRFLDRVRHDSECSTLKYKIAWHLSCIPCYLWHWPKTWFFRKIARKFFPDWYSEYVIKSEEKFAFHAHEKYFDAAHARAVIEYWLSALREE